MKLLAEAFEELVALRYELYNSLFLTLPFESIRRTGSLLPLLARACDDGFRAGQTPTGILAHFRKEHASELSDDDFTGLLFRFIQYMERQVVLFDALEDAAFERVHDMTGEGSIRQLFERARWEDKSDELARRLRSMRLRIVLTAHPTQFYPDSVLGIITDLEAAVRADDVKQVSTLLMQLGRTPFIRREKPTPLAEAEGLVWYLKHVFYHAVPDVVQRLAEEAGMERPDEALPDLLRIGFWPGGDRDGNPFVRARTTRDVARLLRRAILDAYAGDAEVLARRITFRGVDDDVARVRARMEATRNVVAADPATAADTESAADTPLVAGLPPYAHPSELTRDLAAIRERLTEEHAGLFTELVTAFLVRVCAFGFHFASLDVRQDARIHQELDAALEAGDPAPSDVHDDVLQTLAAVKDIQAENGEEALHRYVISNSSAPEDVLRVLSFAERAGWSHPMPLDVVPLFETVPDLEAAPDVMRRLLSGAAYREHVRQRGDVQTIMLGFSDGTKDGGFLAANWSIFRAKETITEAVAEFGVEVAFFDGRGGPPARGGGKTHAYYRALGDRISARTIQLTIQGQTITSNFGTVRAAAYNMEQLLTAGLAQGIEPDRALPEVHRPLLEDLAGRSLEAYRSLKHRPEFLPYMQALGPLTYYGDTNIGSRPSRRGRSSELTLSDLRAIPFVGTWHQMKQNVPGYYGFGRALEEAAAGVGVERLQQLHAESALFRALVENSMMALSKAYFPLTAWAAGHDTFGSMWQDIHEEYERTCRWLREVSGQDELMASRPVGRRSVALRERMVLPLLTIQQAALDAVRRGEEEARALVVRTMYGIINAGRNSA